MNSNPLPQVGTHGFFTSGSDRYPCTVSAVSPSGHRVTVKRDQYRVVKGSAQDGSAEYEFTEDKDGAERVYTRRQDGRYRPAGSSYGSLVLGEWGAYYDPHF